jgi:hypothetical protein
MENLERVHLFTQQFKKCCQPVGLTKLSSLAPTSLKRKSKQRQHLSEEVFTWSDPDTIYSFANDSWVLIEEVVLGDRVVESCYVKFLSKVCGKHLL